MGIVEKIRLILNHYGREIFLFPAHKEVIRALVVGGTLKTHRYLDGRKICKLHRLDGYTKIISSRIVDYLKWQRLIHSNKKFPAATYFLTEKGHQVACRFVSLQSQLEAQLQRYPLSERNYFAEP